MAFYRKWYRSTAKRSKSIKGVFGGKILSQSQIEKLNAKIKSHEATEFAEFEEDFDNQLNQL